MGSRAFLHTSVRPVYARNLTRGPILPRKAEEGRARDNPRRDAFLRHRLSLVGRTDPMRRCRTPRRLIKLYLSEAILSALIRIRKTPDSS